jgi:hypothetical protein
LLFAVPLYNFGVSQYLKTWVDLVVTDPRMAAGTEPMLAGKPALLVTVRGGNYGPGTPRDGWDHATGWMRRILADVWRLDLTAVEAGLTQVGVNPALDRFKELACQVRQKAHPPSATGWRSVMTSPPPPMARRSIASILWFPIFFAIALPVTFEAAFHLPQPHHVPVAVVGTASQVSLMTDRLHGAGARGLDVRQLPSVAAAVAAVRDRQVAAAYVDDGSTPTLYLARAAAPIRASYLQGVFARIAGTRPPAVLDLVPLAAGDGGTGIFFFVFPMMMVGFITAIVLLQAPTWRIGRRVVAVAGVGAVATLAAYLTSVGLNILPDKPLLLVPGFLLTQVFGQLMVGAAPRLKQYFLPAAITFSLILCVPSSGGTVSPDLLPAPFRYLSDALPLAQGVDVTRGVAYFHNADITQPTLLMLLWLAVAAGTVGIAWRGFVVEPSGGRQPA